MSGIMLMKAFERTALVIFVSVVWASEPVHGDGCTAMVRDEALKTLKKYESGSPTHQADTSL